MKKKRTSTPIALLGAASALALGAGDVPAQTGQKAGVAAAVRGPVQQVSFRTPSATVGRNVSSGDEIFLGDRIVTGPAGGLQVMLLDGTTFSVGPNSSMVIDEFVYNPANGTGKLTASLTRGTLRLISGRLARQEQEAIRIKLPVATVGVRGTMSIFAGGPNGWFTGLFGIGPDSSSGRPPSSLVVEVNGVFYQIFRTGWGCTITPADPTCNPQPVGPEFLRQLLGAIAGELRFVDLTEFERLTGLDIVTALGLLQTQGGFEQLWQTINNLFQDQVRPPGFQNPGFSPPPPPPPPPYGE
jgi:hypothetical protein